MKAITVQQPWAWAIARAGKDIENRTQPFHHRGPLAIHAGKAIDMDGLVDPRILEAAAASQNARPLEYSGRVVAVAQLVDVHPCWRGDGHRCCWSPWAIREDGVQHLVLADVRPLSAPLAARGMLGLWDLPADVEAAVAAQLAVAS